MRALFLLVLLAGCTAEVAPGGETVGDVPAPGEPGPVAATAGCDAGGVIADLAPAATDVMVVVDRSGMNLRKLASGKTEWDATRARLVKMAAEMDAPRVRLGMMLYPLGDNPVTCCRIAETTNSISCGCQAGELPANTRRCAVASYKPPAIALSAPGEALGKAFEQALPPLPGFYYPTSMSSPLRAAAETLTATSSDTRKVIFLLNADMRKECGDDPAATSAALLAGAQPVATYVVGVANYTSDPPVHSAVAAAGGDARGDCRSKNACQEYVHFTSFEADLDRALQNLERRALRCVFDVPELPGSGQPRVRVTRAGEEPVLAARDASHTSGWDLVDGGKRLQLYGASCDVAAQGARVQILRGCVE
jgi:hypothetical protein